MQAAETIPLQATTEAIPHPLVEECYQRTAGVLYETRAATQAELSKCITIARDTNRAGLPVDLIEVLAKMKGFENEQLAEAIANLSELVAAHVSPPTPVIPFAGKLITPTAFYEGFPSLKMAASMLLTPVVYAEDTDAIGIASINAIACQLMGDLVVKTVYERVGIRPFMTLVRMDYAVWSALTRKHFGL